MQWSAIRAARTSARILRALIVPAGIWLGACSDSAAPAVGGPSLTIAPFADAVFEGDVVHLTARLYDDNGREVVDAQVSWTVSDATIASVYDDGSLALLRPGTIHISARSGGATASSDLTIQPLVAQRIEFPVARFDLGRGDIVRPPLRVTGAGGRTINGRTVTYASDNESVAAADVLGGIRAVAAGSTTVHATIDGVSATIPVNVVNADTTLDLVRFNGATLPELIAADSVSGNGVVEFHEIYIEGGSLILSGLAQLRYHINVNYAELNVITSGGEVRRIPVRFGQTADQGLLSRGADDTLFMESERVSPLTHSAVPLPDGFVVHFNLAGDNSAWDLTYRRTAPRLGASK